MGIELGADAEAAVALIKRLHDRLPTLTIFAASDDPGVSVLRAVLEAGASDVLSLPLGRQELHKALIRFSQLRTPSTSRPGSTPRSKQRRRSSTSTCSGATWRPS